MNYSWVTQPIAKWLTPNSRTSPAHVPNGSQAMVTSWAPARDKEKQTSHMQASLKLRVPTWKSQEVGEKVLHCHRPMLKATPSFWKVNMLRVHMATAKHMKIALESSSVEAAGVNKFGVPHTINHNTISYLRKKGFLKRSWLAIINSD